MSGSDRHLDALYVSPHLDDAVFSCGGRIHRQVAAGMSVHVVTVCAGDPVHERPSAYAESLHARWGLTPGAVMAARRDEDRVALGLLGASWSHLAVPDCIYRRAEDGAWMYTSDEDLFGEVHPGDADTEAVIGRALADLPGVDGATEVNVPLAIGHHVDHQLVRRAVVAWRGGAGRLVGFEDFPYAALEPFDQRPPWRWRVVGLSDADLDARVTAMALYRSQITSFWRDEDDMASSVRRFATRLGGPERPAERVWTAPVAAW